jgi:hypothetical protein
MVYDSPRKYLPEKKLNGPVQWKVGQTPWRKGWEHLGLYRAHSLRLTPRPAGLYDARLNGTRGTGFRARSLRSPYGELTGFATCPWRRHTCKYG